MAWLIFQSLYGPPDKSVFHQVDNRDHMGDHAAGIAKVLVNSIHRLPVMPVCYEFITWCYGSPPAAAPWNTFPQTFLGAQKRFWTLSCRVVRISSSSACPWQGSKNWLLLATGGINNAEEVMCCQQPKTICSVPANTVNYLICFFLFLRYHSLILFVSNTSQPPRLSQQHFETNPRILMKCYSNHRLQFVQVYSTASLNERKLSISQFYKFFPIRIHFCLQ